LPAEAKTYGGQSPGLSKILTLKGKTTKLEKWTSQVNKENERFVLWACNIAVYARFRLAKQTGEEMKATLPPQPIRIPPAKPPGLAKKRAGGRLAAAAVLTVGLSTITAASPAHLTLPETSSSAALHAPPAKIKAPQFKKAYGQLPLSFAPNRGQTNSQVKFLSRGAGYQLFLTATEAVLALQQSSPRAKSAPKKSQEKVKVKKTAPTVLRMQLLGANPAPEISGVERLPGQVNYLQGKDPAQWHTQIPTYAQVKYQGVYPGIDLLYYGQQRQLEYDFIVAPGAHPRTIRLAFEGAKKLEINAEGELVLKTSGGPVRFQRPVMYQTIGGTRREVAGGYMLTAPHEVGFQVATYDTSQPLIIDPVLSYSTYLGGNGWDEAYDIAVDGSGQAYVAGGTESTNFPVTAEAFQMMPSGGSTDYSEAFVAKLSADGSRLVYATYLGGSNGDEAYGIAVDGQGQAYVAGYTGSDNFPVTTGAFQPVFGGGYGYGDAFVAQLSADGSRLIYATYLGGNGSDGATGIAVDGQGQAYVAGFIDSTNFPVTTGALQPVFGGGYSDAFVAQLSADGSTLAYATYLGGNGSDGATGIAVDGQGRAYVAGSTFSTDFPVTGSAFQPVLSSNGGYSGDAFVAQLSVDGSSLIYSTYLGGNGGDGAAGIAVDGQGRAYVTGSTSSTNFPVTAGALQPVFGGGYSDAFVAQLSADGTRLVYATYLGGSGFDGATAIAVDGYGRHDQAYVAGYTASDDFPMTADAFQPVVGGGAYDTDAFVAQLSADGTALIYSTYLGGSRYDEGAIGIVVDGQGQAYVVGHTTSLDFPVTAGAFQTVYGGGYHVGDAFIAKLNISASSPSPCPGERLVTGIHVSRSGYRRSRSSGNYLQQLTLTNTGSAPIAGPLALVVDNLALVPGDLGANATVVNASGQTTCAVPVGSPYVSVTLSGNTLNPGQSATVTLELANPTNQAFNYTTRVLVLNSPPA
jgi:hypothetical protein